jgi:hypothetical protein
MYLVMRLTKENEMNQEQVMKRLKAKATKQINELQVKGYSAEYIEKVNPRTVSGLTYKIGRNYFENARRTCGFNPETMEGHSYRWYSLVKQIKGTVYLNTYRYSSETSKHIRRVEQVLKDLGIKYKEIEAPRGLQSIDTALAYAIRENANRMVADKYGRDKIKPRFIKDQNIKNLEALGYKVSKKALTAALKESEASRSRRLERQREERALKKAMASVRVVSDFRNLLAANAGIHVTKPYGWQGEVFTNVNSLDTVRQEAVAKGFDTIYVHSAEPRRLNVVK